MLGFKPVRPEELAGLSGSKDPGYVSELSDINEKMTQYLEVNALIHQWLILSTEDIDVVYSWRLEAEKKMRQQRQKEPLGATSGAAKAALSDEEVRDFVSRFMPAYKLYLPDLYAHGPFNYVDIGGYPYQFAPLS